MAFYPFVVVIVGQIRFTETTTMSTYDNKGKWYEYEIHLTHLLLKAKYRWYNDNSRRGNDKILLLEDMSYPRTNMVDAKTTQRTKDFIFVSFITTKIRKILKQRRHVDKHYCSNGCYL